MHIQSDYQTRDQIVFKFASTKLRHAAIKHGWDLKELVKEGGNLEMIKKYTKLIEVKKKFK